MSGKSFSTEILDAWSTESKAVLSRLKDSRQKIEKKYKEEYQNIMLKIKDFEAELQTISDLSSNQKDRLLQLTLEIEKLSLTADDQVTQVDHEKENIHSLEETKTKTVNALMTKEMMINTKLEKLEKGIKNFQENLGLTLEYTPNSHLKFVFTFIDEQDVNRPFCFKINVEGTPGIYFVLDCDPLVENLQELVKELNETNNLKIFLFKMRKAFKSISKK